MYVGIHYSHENCYSKTQSNAVYLDFHHPEKGNMMEWISHIKAISYTTCFSTNRCPPTLSLSPLSPFIGTSFIEATTSRIRLRTLENMMGVGWKLAGNFIYRHQGFQPEIRLRIVMEITLRHTKRCAIYILLYQFRVAASMDPCSFGGRKSHWILS